MRMTTAMMDSNRNEAQELKPLRPPMRRPIFPPYGLRNPNFVSISDHEREIVAAPLVSTRWNPTPEQLQALEEMYRRGIRTPSAEQIQHIAAKLRRFGKIGGKNVFYWFQNHKARERQKKRRQLAARTIHPTPPGLIRGYLEIEQHKVLNCCTPSKDSASMQGAVIAADGWNHKEELEAKAKVVTVGNEWQSDLDLSSSSSKGQENTKPYFYGISHQNQTTLHLFPSPQLEDSHIHHTFTPTSFFEFLPIKN
ncbi:hypothetical protein SASPL_149372 [Salvia splendens]|uniref:Homeobox domain-containing protein n=1 Tax=Salvia splendens TaxID=180675 RepID=A0A8X8Z4L7_SALSN|nr:WUSCHEL-related homeobox 3-like [Salvia splendens]KAG6391616.1 hypothetical protein SASPL_149372 [Salvia splendens]